MKVVSVGKRKHFLQDDAVKIHFRYFSELRGKVYDYIDSPLFESHQILWYVRLFPQGCDSRKLNSDDQYIGVYLHVSNKEFVKDEHREITIKYTVSVPSLDITVHMPVHTFRNNGQGHGKAELASRRATLNGGCADDALTVVVDIHKQYDRNKSWAPTVIYNKDMHRHFLLSTNADVIFHVGKGEEAQQIKANSAILFLHAPQMREVIGELPQLAMAGRDSVGDQVKDIHIPEVNPVPFLHMLRFVYANDLSFIDCHSDLQYLQSLLVLANKFECIKLKLTVEGALIDYHLNSLTAVELLLFADGHSCAMLKEAAMLLIVNSPSIFLLSPDCTAIGQSQLLMTEMHQYATRTLPNDGIIDKYADMTVDELYAELESENTPLLCSDMSRLDLVRMVRKKRTAKPAGN